MFTVTDRDRHLFSVNSSPIETRLLNLRAFAIIFLRDSMGGTGIRMIGLSSSSKDLHPLHDTK